MGDAYPHGLCRYSFNDGHTRVMVGTRSSVVGTGVTLLPFQYSSTQTQGLTFVHFLPQLKRFLRDMGYIWGLSRRCVGYVRGYWGLSRVYSVSEAAQVELKSGRV